jgi:hypothetical protein
MSAIAITSSGGVVMKLQGLFCIAALSLSLLGCDGDGDGIGVTTDTTDTTEETKAPVIIDTGSGTVAPSDYSVLSDFDIFETGIIEGTAEWSSGPSKLNLILSHDSTVKVQQNDVESPATVLMEATQDLLNNSNGWVFVVDNTDLTLQADVDFTVRFTPD